MKSRNGLVSGCDSAEEPGVLIHDLDALLTINQAIASKEGSEPMDTLGLNEIRTSERAPEIPSLDDFPPLESIKGTILKKQKEQEYRRGRGRQRSSGPARVSSSSRDSSVKNDKQEDSRTDKSMSRRARGGQIRGRAPRRPRPRPRPLI